MARDLPAVLLFFPAPQSEAPADWLALARPVACVDASYNAEILGCSVSRLLRPGPLRRPSPAEAHEEHRRANH